MANKLTEADAVRMREIFTKYGLAKTDIHNHKHYVIITRSGIEKIQAKAGIKVEFECIDARPDFAAVKAVAKRSGSDTIQSFGSASPQNCQSKYFLEMAEKRALSRVVLKLENLYNELTGEDEIPLDDK